MAKCMENKRLKLLDCTDMSLKTMEGLLHGAKPWVYVVDLRRNLLVWINDTLLLSVFPNLQLVDLLKNPNIDCRLILELKITVSKCKTKAFLTTQQSLLQMNSCCQYPQQPSPRNNPFSKQPHWQYPQQHSAHNNPFSKRPH